MCFLILYSLVPLLFLAILSSNHRLSIPGVPNPYRLTAKGYLVPGYSGLYPL